MFQTPQPTGGRSLRKFPKAIRGTYISPEDNDTIKITKRKVVIDEVKNKEEVASISDSLVVKKYRNYYFLNLRNDKTETWELVVMQKIGSGELKLMTIEGGDKKAIQKVRKITTVKEVRNEDGKLDAYLLSPTNAELIKMLEEDGVFEGLGTLKKVGG